jgi:hypothetical protein
MTRSGIYTATYIAKRSKKMKNLIFAALVVSVMLVLAVGTASADFVGGEGDTRYDRAQEASGGSVGGGEAEAGGGSGGSGGPVVEIDDGDIARFDNSSLRFKLD